MQGMKMKRPIADKIYFNEAVILTEPSHSLFRLKYASLNFMSSSND